MLLDTGLRASELCSLKVGDVDMQTGKVEIKHGAKAEPKAAVAESFFSWKSGQTCSLASFGFSGRRRRKNTYFQLISVRTR